MNICELLSDELIRLHNQAQNARTDEDYGSEEEYVEAIKKVYSMIEMLIQRTETTEVEVPSSDIEVPELEPVDFDKFKKEFDKKKNEVTEKAVTYIPGFPGD